MSRVFLTVLDAVGAGEALIYVKCNGTVVDAALVNVVGGIEGADTVGVDESDYCYVKGGELFAWSWSSDNPAIASMDEEGHLTGEGVGTTTIRATYTASDGSSINLAKNVTVVNAKNI